ncbi:hypothetical protein AAG906_019431 [Vitis piasezkii]
MRDLPSNFFKDAAHVLLENGAAYVFLLNSRTASSSIWCALMFQPKVHAWYSPYAGKVLENSVVTLHDTVEILWKLGCEPLKSYRRGGCLRVDWLSSTHDAFQTTKKMPTHAYWFFLSRWRLIPLLFPWRIRGDPIPGYEDLEASKE